MSCGDGGVRRPPGCTASPMAAMGGCRGVSPMCAMAWAHCRKTWQQCSAVSAVAAAAAVATTPLPGKDSARAARRSRSCRPVGAPFLVVGSRTFGSHRNVPVTHHCWCAYWGGEHSGARVAPRVPVWRCCLGSRRVGSSRPGCFLGVVHPPRRYGSDRHRVR